MAFDRRRFIKAAGAGVGASALGFPAIVRAQETGPIRLGLLTVLTGPLASGGIDMEAGIRMYLEDIKYTIAGRKVELIVADTAGVPATARTKMQELVERNRVHAITGPLDAGSALAIDDYIKDQQIPTLSLAAAEDMTQRKPNPWFVRATSTSSHASQPLADYCFKTLKYRRMATIADDIPYGHEMCGGFHRVFEDLGGKIVQKLFPPLTVPDYGTYLAQMKTNIDGIFLGFAGSNGFRWYRQYNEYGLRGKVNVVGGMTAFDESVLRNMGDEVLGVLTACWYSAELDNPINRKFAPAFRAKMKYDPGYYGAGMYANGAIFQNAVEQVKGKVEDKPALMKALRATNIDTCRGRVRFDQYGNVVGDIYIRKVERKDNRLVNTVIFTYPNVSQFWTYKPDEFLRNPVYSRDYPPAKNLE